MKKMAKLEIHHDECLHVIRKFASGSFALICIDPPFNTGRDQTHKRLRTLRDDAGERVGFQGRRYRSITIGETSFADRFDDFLAFLEPRLREAIRVMKRRLASYG